MKTQNPKQVILIAIAKGFLHATVIPISLMFAMLYYTENTLAFLTPFAYVAFASFVYAKSKNKDIAKAAFFKTLMILLTIVMFAALFIIG